MSEVLDTGIGGGAACLDGSDTMIAGRCGRLGSMQRIWI